MKIAPITIPWAADGNLGAAYNTAANLYLKAGCTHLPFMDHDVMMLARDWHALLAENIERYPDAGLFTCRVNMQWHGQRSQSLHIEQDLNIEQQLDVAAQLRKAHGTEARKIGVKGHELISGFFFCVHIKRFLDAGGAPDGFLGVDNEIHKRLHEAGYPAYVIEGMLCWHRAWNLEPREQRIAPFREGHFKR